jgi:hypothetical protein
MMLEIRKGRVEPTAFTPVEELCPKFSKLLPNLGFIWQDFQDYFYFSTNIVMFISIEIVINLTILLII